mgnify:CR=1 FL=1
MAKRNDLMQQAELLEKIEALEKRIEERGKATTAQQKQLNKAYQESFKQQSASADLGKKLNDFNKSILGKVQKQLGFEKSINAIAAVRASGTKKDIKNADKLLDIMTGYADGSKTINEALNELGDNDFGKLETVAVKFGIAVKKGGEDLEKSIKRGKILTDTFDGILQSITGINFAELFTAAGALAALQQFVSSTLEIRQSLGTSVMESARLAGNVKSAAISAKLLGGSSEEAEAAVTGLVEEFGSLSVVSLETSVNLGKLVATTGITGKNAAALLKQLEAINGASLETNINLLSSVSSLARAEGVAPAQVLNSIAEDTKTFAEFAKDGGMNLARAAIEARKLGLNLKDVTTIADNLLEFESSIAQEMQASLLIGRQLNLDTARRFALEGNMVGVMEEVKRQVGGQAEFEAMNVVQRRELAKAIGIGADDLAKIVAGEKTSAQLAEEKVEREKQFLTLQKAAANAQIVTAIASIFAGTGKFGPLGAGLAMASVLGMMSMINSAPKLEKGGIVKETGMAVVHKGEVFSGTRNEMGMGNGQTNKLLRELITQNEFLMNRLTNRVGDITLSKT